MFQRLSTKSRNVLARPGASTGLCLYENALAGGSRALGQDVAGLTAGAAADIVSLNATAATVAGHTPDTLLDAWIFGRKPLVDCVWTRASSVSRADGTPVATMRRIDMPKLCGGS